MKWLNETSESLKVWIRLRNILRLFVIFLLDTAFPTTKYLHSRTGERLTYAHTSMWGDFSSGTIIRVWYCGNYKFKPFKKMIWDAKYRNDESATKTCGTLLADEMISFLSEDLLHTIKTWYVLYIPSTTHNSGTKNFDHMNSILRQSLPFLESFNVTMPPTSILEIVTNESTTENKLLSRKERINTAAGKFSCHQDLRGKYVMLVDDIVTTGASMLAGIEAVRKAGAIHIYCMALAH